MDDDIDPECPDAPDGEHSWDEQETGPVNYRGGTELYLVCEWCDESVYKGKGGGVL